MVLKKDIAMRLTKIEHFISVNTGSIFDLKVCKISSTITEKIKTLKSKMDPKIKNIQPFFYFHTFHTTIQSKGRFGMKITMLPPADDVPRPWDVP